MESMPRVARTELLTAALVPPASVARVEVKEVTMGPRQGAPLHLHPCPVVGVVTEGAIAYQLEGQPVRRLATGEAFYEPAGARVARFDNEADEPARFVAVYLVGEDGGELIRMLDP